jgi:uncharacterized protein (DUF2236 family)
MTSKSDGLADHDDLAARLAADWRVLLLAPTALVLQVAHPVIGAGVGRYSNYATDPWGRSVWPVMALVMIEDRGYGADLRALHKGIGGVDDRGRKYHAWDPEAAFFVLATACYISDQLRILFGTPLIREEREAVFLAWRRAGQSFGIPERELPADLAAYDVWFARVLADSLEDHPTVHELLSTLRSAPPLPGVPGWLWRPLAQRVIGPIAMLMVVGTLPPLIRERLGLTWTSRDQRRLRTFARLVRLVNALLPGPLRSVNWLIVRRYEQQIRQYAAHGAELRIAPSIATDKAGRHVA